MSCRSYTVCGPSIVVGWPYRLRVTFTSAVIDGAGSYKSQIKASRVDASPLFTLTNGNGLTLAVDGTYIDFDLTEAQTAALSPGSVCLDLGRTDIKQYLNFILTIPVVSPVTVP